jgi:hypothetical protein
MRAITGVPIADQDGGTRRRLGARSARLTAGRQEPGRQAQAIRGVQLYHLGLGRQEFPAWACRSREIDQAPLRDVEISKDDRRGQCHDRDRAHNQLRRRLAAGDAVPAPILISWIPGRLLRATLARRCAR